MMPDLRLPTSVCAIAVLLVSHLCNADDPRDAPLSPDRVQRLIGQLDADTLARRVNAERRLLELGPDVLIHLPHPDTLNSSASQALKRIRQFLEQKQARFALRAGRVTLSGSRTLENIIDEIASQTGNTLVTTRLPNPLGERLFSVDFEQTPFWEAIGRIEEQARIKVRTGERRSSLAVMPRTDDDRLRDTFVVDGPFRIDVLKATFRPDFINPERRILRLTFAISTEPRLRTLFVHTNADEITVSQSASSPISTIQVTLPPLSPQASRELSADTAGPVRITHDVVVPPEDPLQRIETLNVQGTFKVEVAAAEERFEFRHLSESGPISRRHGGVSVTLNEVQHHDTDLHATLQISYDSGGPRFESHRSWVFHNAVWLTNSAQSERIRPAQFDTLIEGHGGATLRYRFPNLPTLNDETCLTYVAPTLVTHMPVKFSLREIPIDK